MRIFLTGATGYIGSAVLDALLRAGHEVTALVRDPECGTFVAPSTALSYGSGAQMRFFCSEKCRRAYQAKFPK